MQTDDDSEDAAPRSKADVFYFDPIARQIPARRPKLISFTETWLLRSDGPEYTVLGVKADLLH